MSVLLKLDLKWLRVSDTITIFILIGTDNILSTKFIQNLVYFSEFTRRSLDHKATDELGIEALLFLTTEYLCSTPFPQLLGQNGWANSFWFPTL